MNVPAQIFGFIALILISISLQFDKRKKVLKFQALSNIFYSLQYLMLNAYSALFICFIGLIRSTIFSKYEEKNKDVPIYVLLIIVGLIIYSGILSYTNLLSIIPIFIGIIYSTFIWQKNLSKFRIASMLCSIVWIFYNFKVGAYIGIVPSILEFVSSFYAFLKLDIKKAKT